MSEQRANGLIVGMIILVAICFGCGMLVAPAREFSPGIIVTNIEEPKPDKAAEILAYVQVEKERGFWKMIQTQARASAAATVINTLAAWTVAILALIVAAFVTIWVVVKRVK